MPDQLPGIVVVGQRRLPGGSFPTGGSSGTGGGPGEGGVHQNEVGMEDPPAPTPDPCADPATALEWNADAAAAEAAKEFARLAGAMDPPEDLNTREWGAFLYRNSDGSVRVSPISHGDPFQSGGVGNVVLIREGSEADIVGFVHSHRNGSHLPSDGPNAENPGDIQVLDSVVQSSGVAGVRMYIVAQNQGPVGFTPCNQINVYDTSNASSARASFTLGPEVNPEAQPCPGS